MFFSRTSGFCAHRLEGSRFANWQLDGSAAGGSRERFQVLPPPTATARNDPVRHELVEHPDDWLFPGPINILSS
jgi:hypothetical protein